MILKALIVGLLIAFAEVINGNIRVRFLHKKFAKARAKRLGLLFGSVIIFLICWFALPWIGPESYGDCFAVGFAWLFIMMALDLYFARNVFKLNWNNVLNDFNPMKGNLLSLGMLFLFFCPMIVFSLYR